MEAGVEGNTPILVASTRAFGGGDLGRWFHIAVVYDSAGMSTAVYVDGVLDSSVAHTGVNDASLTPAQIGAYGASRWLDGRMDDVRLYSRALSDSGINQVYNATR